MSVLKSELKMLVSHELGARVEDTWEVAKKDLAILEGRQGAFLDGATAVEALMGFVDKDIDEGKLDLVAADIVKRYLMRAGNALKNLGQQAANMKVAQAGKISGLDQAMAIIKKEVDAERTKIEALKAAASVPPPENPRDRPVGEAPLSIKAQRLDEEAREARMTEAAERQDQFRKEDDSPIAASAGLTESFPLNPVNFPPDAPLEVVQVTVAQEAPQEVYPPAPEPETIPPPVPMNGLRKKQGKSHGRNAR